MDTNACIAQLFTSDNCSIKRYVYMSNVSYTVRLFMKERSLKRSTCKWLDYLTNAHKKISISRLERPIRPVMRRARQNENTLNDNNNRTPKTNDCFVSFSAMDSISFQFNRIAFLLYHYNYSKKANRCHRTYFRLCEIQSTSTWIGSRHKQKIQT